MVINEKKSAGERAWEIIKRYVIDSQVFVALCGSCYVYNFGRGNEELDFRVWILVFFTYLSGYLWTKYGGRKFVKRYLAVGLGSLAYGIWVLWNKEDYMYKWLIVCVLGFFYNSGYTVMEARRLPYVKMFFVSFVWGMFSGWVVQREFDIHVFSFTFLFIAGLIFPFDIRDAGSDEIATFANRLGEKRAKMVGNVIFLLSLFVIGLNRGNMGVYLSILVSMLILNFSRGDRREYYFSVYAEFCSVMPLALSLLIEKI